MSKRELIEWGVYFALLGLSWVFIDRTFKEFIEGRTNYVTATEAISVQDHPTVTVCFDYKDRVSVEDMNVTTIFMNTDNEEETFDLLEGSNTVTGMEHRC